MASVFIAYKFITNEITNGTDIDFGFVTEDSEKILNFWESHQDYVLTQEQIVE